MKRPIASRLAAILAPALALGVAACGQPAPPAEEAAPISGWIMPPAIDAVAASGADLMISGHAAPQGRVVVSGAGGLAYAAGADAEGRFELRVPRPAQDTLFVVEARAGEIGLPAPYRLLIGSDPQAPIALLAIGAPTRRLDPAPSLDAVDSDGRAAFLSGRAPSGRAVVVGGAADRPVVADAEGRWRLTGVGDGAADVVVDGARYSPLPIGGGPPGVLERAGTGWRIVWVSPGGGRQTTWFPDRPETNR